MNQKDKETFENYHLTLVIQNKKDTRLASKVNIDGALKLDNVFKEETLTELADGLRHGEKEFNDYLERGVIKQNENGEFELNAPKETFIDITPEEKNTVELVKNKEDLKGGIIED